jgi:hypothetical protein
MGKGKYVAREREGERRRRKEGELYLESRNTRTCANNRRKDGKKKEGQVERAGERRRREERARAKEKCTKSSNHLTCTLRGPATRSSHLNRQTPRTRHRQSPHDTHTFRPRKLHWCSWSCTSGSSKRARSTLLPPLKGDRKRTLLLLCRTCRGRCNSLGTSQFRRPDRSSRDRTDTCDRTNTCISPRALADPRHERRQG